MSCGSIQVLVLISALGFATASPSPEVEFKDPWAHMKYLPGSEFDADVEQPGPNWMAKMQRRETTEPEQRNAQQLTQGRAEKAEAKVQTRSEAKAEVAAKAKAEAELKYTSNEGLETINAFKAAGRGAISALRAGKKLAGQLQKAAVEHQAKLQSDEDQKTALETWPATRRKQMADINAQIAEIERKSGETEAEGFHNNMEQVGPLMKQLEVLEASVDAPPISPVKNAVLALKRSAKRVTFVKASQETRTVEASSKRDDLEVEGEEKIEASHAVEEAPKDDLEERSAPKRVSMPTLLAKARIHNGQLKEVLAPATQELASRLSPAVEKVKEISQTQKFKSLFKVAKDEALRKGLETFNKMAEDQIKFYEDMGVTQKEMSAKRAKKHSAQNQRIIEAQRALPTAAESATFVTPNE